MLFCKILRKIQTTFLANPIHEENRSVQLNSSHLHYLLKVRVLSVFDWMTATNVRFMVLKWHTLQAPLLDFMKVLVFAWLLRQLRNCQTERHRGFSKTYQNLYRIVGLEYLLRNEGAISLMAVLWPNSGI